MDEVTQGLGRDVRQRRVRAGMSQVGLGEAIGREQKYISELERGSLVNLPGPDIIRGIAGALRCSPSDLLTAAGYLDPSDPTESMLLADDVHSARREADQLQRMATDLARRLAAIESSVAIVTNHPKE